LIVPFCAQTGAASDENASPNVSAMIENLRFSTAKFPFAK
jgi:hypothetical protein